MIKISADGLEDAVLEILKEYGDIIYQATEEGLTAAEKVLIKNLKGATPKRTGRLAKGWKGKGKKYKLRRFVGNTTTVIGKSGEIPLTNILEYSTKKGNPFIKKTLDRSINEMARAVVNEIKKEA